LEVDRKPLVATSGKVVETQKVASGKLRRYYATVSTRMFP